ncbi:hypothetical protein FisN_15Lh246 [Fistulifera solaris]|uniref:Solute carrier family 35 (UDP-sugar transporter), member A1/2/3 n=1 Tax=Fistulifera solaris TaxID=1519565 RepID=A0A1Z5JBI0_FISSO|nr:hypothetical protein FisN_15Lh246 [Fistulifera solaris]|eukprot:GAX11316.1 hypothetical protein FisN_15Lh246 [Fistulifera solaris]
MKNVTISGEAVIYLALLALQFGLQPILMQRYAPVGIIRSTVVILQEVTKFLFSGSILLVNQSWSSALQDWSTRGFLTEAVLPAGLYGIQNVAYLMAVQTLDPLTFNVLAQTKTLSAALCCYLLLGRKQSRTQIIALLLLLWAALIMEGVIFIDFTRYWERDTSSSEWEWHHLTHGVLPILLSTFISGLAGALSQGALQHKNSYLFSMELCAAQSLLLVTSLCFSSDGTMILEKGFFHQWEWATFLPIMTGAVGGVLVGLVTKHAGAVYKGFALITGMFLSGVLQSSSVSLQQAVGGTLAAISIFLHATNPPRSAIVKESKKKN